ncbi:class I SAM-dependent methyltransferase [soil metagenome]
MNVEEKFTPEDQVGAANKHCTVCGSTQLRTLLRFDAVPVHQNLLYPSYEAARSCAFGQIELVACERCDFIFNKLFDGSLLDYSEEYENTQDKSASFAAHMSAVAKSLVERHGLDGKRILEIGCGKGGFLHLLVQISAGLGKGFDPSYLNEFDSVATLTFVQDFFPAKEPWWNPDQIVCRHVLEHISTPFDFVKMIRDAIPPGQFPRIYFEVPSFDWIAKNLAFWDVFYEHCNYFTPASMQRLFQACGFEVERIELAFSDQYLSVDLSVPNSIDREVRAHRQKSDYESLSLDFKHKMDDLLALIRTQRAAGKSIAVWGAAAKGSTFLNQLSLSTEILPNVIDINPRKQGNFIAGTGQLICAPEFLRTDKRDVIYVMNPNYENEIRQQLNEMNLFPELVVI